MERSQDNHHYFHSSVSSLFLQLFEKICSHSFPWPCATVHARTPAQKQITGGTLPGQGASVEGMFRWCLGWDPTSISSSNLLKIPQLAVTGVYSTPPYMPVTHAGTLARMAIIHTRAPAPQNQYTHRAALTHSRTPAPVAILTPEFLPTWSLVTSALLPWWCQYSCPGGNYSHLYFSQVDIAHISTPACCHSSCRYS